MKTIQVNQILRIYLAAMAMLLLPSLAKSQVTCGTNWQIVNNTTCNIYVNFFYTCNGASCSTSNLGVQVLNGSPVTIPACASSSGCGSNCNVLVRIVKINGAGYVGPGVDFFNQTAPINSTDACFTSGSPTLTWDISAPNTVNINP